MSATSERGRAPTASVPVDAASASRRAPASAPVRPAAAYVVGLYPAISHTFILREIEALRRRGAQIITISIHGAAAQDMPSVADREAFESTYYILPVRPLDHLKAHGRAVASSPRRYLRTLRRALRGGDHGAKAKLRQLAYFGEAVVCWWRCRRDGVRHVHGEFCGPASDAAMLAALLGGPGWTWSFAAHGTDILQVSRERLAAKVIAATFVTVASDFGRALIMSMVPTEHWDKLEVVRCGVDLGEYALRPPRAGRRADGVIDVLCVGRLEREKGQRLLLEAAAHPGLSESPLRLTLIGDGSELDALRAYASQVGLGSRVRFPGRVGQDEIRTYYRDADVFCLASLGEGVPVVLMEAMAMGIPVIAPRLMGIPELVEDAVSGLLFSPGRPDDLARALHALAGSPELRRELGLAGRDRIEREFEVNACAAELAAVFARHGAL